MTKPAYSLGSANPISFHSFSGADIKIYKLPKDAMIDDLVAQDFVPIEDRGKCLGQCTAFSYTERVGKGALRFICLDGNFSPLSDERYHLLIIATDEYGHCSVMAFKNVFEEDRSFGISIDDTTMEYTISISFTKVLLWRKVK